MSIKTNQIICFFIVIVFCILANNIEARDLKRIYSEVNTSGLAFGPTFKFKRVEGPLDFGGDMIVWGIRSFGGKANGCKFGIECQRGILNGRSIKMQIRMGGFSIEDTFSKDVNHSWRITIGGGDYFVKSRFSDYTYRQGAFVYFEPLIMRILPISRHIRLQVGGGYTFTNTARVRIEGFCGQVEFLIGRY